VESAVKSSVESAGPRVEGIGDDQVCKKYKKKKKYNYKITEKFKCIEAHYC
jgi:hypothetical protein